MEKEIKNDKDVSQKRDSDGHQPSGPYPIELKGTSSPKLTKKTSAKGRLSAIRSSLRRDVEGIKSSMRKVTQSTDNKLTKSQEIIKPEDVPLPDDPKNMPRKNKKSKSSKAASAIVRRLSIGKQKNTTIQPKEFQQDDKSESDKSTTQMESNPSLNPVEPVATMSEPTITSDLSDNNLEVINNRSGGDGDTSTVLDDFLNNLTENQSPTTLQIPLGSPTTSLKSDQDIIEHDKTESCDEENDNTEDHLSSEQPSSWKPYKSNENLSSMIEANTERREHLYKILVIGELGTGKTSIIKRYVHQFFSQHYRATIGVDFALKLLNWDANTIIRLQLWDIAGQERFGNMTRVYYKEAVGAFIVFDVTRVATFDAVVKWKMDLDTKVQLSDGSPIPCILLANKCDQQKEGLVNTPAKMDEYCKDRGFAGWFETSAKENINIEEAGRSLVNKILLNDKLIHGNDPKKDAETIALEGKSSESQSTTNKYCSC